MIKAVALDVDGTITEKKRIIPPEAWAAIKLLEDHGVKVMFASGNAVCVLMGLHYYSGATGPMIGENGGVVAYQRKIHVLAKRPVLAQRARQVIIEELGDLIEESWQNRYRHADYAFKLKKEDVSRREVVEAIKRVLEEKGLKGLEVLDSKVAFHVHEIGVNKGNGLVKAAELLNIDLDEIAAIGDSEVDIPMFKKAGLSIAVGNAIDELKREATIVLKEPYYLGFLKAVEIILKENKR